MTKEVYKTAAKLGLILLLIGLWYASVTDGRQLMRLRTENATLTKRVNDLTITVANLTEIIQKQDDKFKQYDAVASWYGPGFNGKRAADGSIYNQEQFTAAHKSLPLGTIVIFEANGVQVPAVITDRGPYIKGRDFDLSLGLAERLGIVRKGVAPITVYEVKLK